MKERVFAWLLLILILVLSSCGKEASYAESTVYGKVTKIEGNRITLTLGSMEADQMLNIQPEGEIPFNFPGVKEEIEEGDPFAPNEIPEDGLQPGNNGMPDIPDSDGKNGTMDDGRMPMQRPDGQGKGNNFGSNRYRTAFKEGSVVLKVDLNKATLTKNGVALENSELSEGQILSIVFDSNGEAKSATVLDFSIEELPDPENPDNKEPETVIPPSEDLTVEEGTLLQVKGGDQIAFVLDGQSVSGNILVDSSSTLDFTLKNGSSYTGALTIEEDGIGSGTNSLMVVVGSDCVWNLTGNSTVSSLTNEGSIVYNGYTITLSSGKILTGE
ncbi:MAG: hypothetical protein ACI3XN_01710 [Eubacteriales bacterium]